MAVEKKLSSIETSCSSPSITPEENIKSACVLVGIASWMMITIIALGFIVASFADISQLNASLRDFENVGRGLQETNMRLRQSLSGIEDRRQLIISYLINTGLFRSHPAASCAAILQFAPSSSSGHYWVRSSDGSAIHVYCDMTRSCGDTTGGWMRVAELDMRDSSSQCPGSLTLSQGQNCTGRTCVISNPDYPSCPTTTINTFGVSYSKVCGKIRGYQYRAPDGFQGRSSSDFNVESNYVDGVSLTHRSPTSEHTHIWTFAAAGIYVAMEIMYDG